MHIIIVGCGKVGNSLAYHLTKEACDVTVIDTNLKLIEKFTQTHDIIGIHGNGTSRDTLLQADVAAADMLIAVTQSDEINTLCCVMGKALGAKHTVARIRKPEYSNQTIFMHKSLAIDVILNPDQEAANYISRMIKYPSAIQVESFVKGKVSLIEFEIGAGNPLAGYRLADISHDLHIDVLVCCVIRQDQVFIPNGSFVLAEKDRIYITASSGELANFFKNICNSSIKIKNVMIVGGGSISYYLAKNLEDMRMNVRIIEIDQQRANDLSKLIPYSTVIHGDGTDPEVLDEENLDNMDACISLTGIDEENIIISLYANSKNVDKVITKINRLGFVKIISNAGIGSIITPKEIMVNRIVRYVRAIINSQGSNVQTLYKLVDDRVEALEFKVAEDADFVNVPIRNLMLKPDIMLAYIIRNGKIIFPRGNDFLLPDDSVIIVTTTKYLADLKDIFEKTETIAIFDMPI
ncbi:MAG: Trk system potassium transporter TrkA [Peptostreptococcaceae bacterium]|nr:Trk system potassium transporter TrkA [Peptostreptococcaceae bacterium]